MTSHHAALFGRREAYAAVVAIGLFLGLTGIRWGLPGPGRLERILPPGVHGPEFHGTLVSSWKDIHARLGPNLMLNPDAFGTFSGVQEAPAGWKLPPPLLYNAVRSFHVRTTHDDEQSIFLALSKMRPRRLDFNPHFFAYGGAYIYSVGAWLGAGALLGAVPLHASMMPYLEEPEKMGAMFFWGRLLSVAAYIGCGLILLEIGGAFLRPRAGVLAAVLFMLSPAVVIQAHTMKQYTFWTFFSFLTLYFSLKALSAGRRRDYVLAGAASGIAVGTTLMAWSTGLIVAAAALLRVRKNPTAWRGEAASLAAAAAAGIAAFLITNPYWALDFAHAYGEFKVLAAYSAFRPVFFLRLLASPYRVSVTTPVFLLVCAGVLWSLTKGRRDPRLALCACAFFLVMSASFTLGTAAGGAIRTIRYVLPAIGSGALLGSVFLDEMLVRFPRWRKAAMVALALAVANLGMEGTLYALNFRRAATERSNHHLAGDWIGAHVPEGSVIGLLRDPAPSNSPYFPYQRFRVRLIQEDLFGTLAADRLPDYFVVTSPDYDDRPRLEPNLTREFEPVALFDRYSLGWTKIRLGATTANPLIAIYRRKTAGAPQ